MSVHRDQENRLWQYIEKARRSLAAAQRNCDAGDYDFAASRAYYAAFYCMEAVLRSKNLIFSKHAGTISAFNQHFVKQGIFPRIFGKYINQLFSERQTGDYMLGLGISEADAKKDIEIAGEMVHAIFEYLKMEGYLTRMNTD